MIGSTKDSLLKFIQRALQGDKEKAEKDCKKFFSAFLFIRTFVFGGRSL